MWSKNKWQAFTLIETLLVLEVSLLFIYLPVVRIEKSQVKSDNQLFYQQLEERLQHAQQLAIVSQRTTRVLVDKELTYVTFMYTNTSGKPQQEILPMPTSIQAKKGWMMVFLPVSGGQGTADNQFRNFIFIDSYQQKEITYQFQMGSGKYVRSEKSL